MHVSRSIHFAADRPAQAPAERGFTLAVILLALLGLGGSLWLNQHGVPAASCGADLAIACTLL